MIGRWTKPPVEAEEQPRGFDGFELKLGDVMRGERATIGKSLLDVQRELKIKATYIAAIEKADPSAFQTQGFIAGYVRSYARYLELDPDWAFDRFCAESGFEVAHGMSPAASTKRPAKAAAVGLAAQADPFADPNASFVPRGESFFARIEPGALGSTAVLIGVICVIGYGGWSVLQEIQKVQLAPVDQAPGLVAEAPVLGGSETTLAQLDATLSVDAPSSEALDRLYRPQALDVPIMVPRDGPIAALDPSSVGSLARPAAPSLLDSDAQDLAQADPLNAEPAIQVTEDAAAELALVAVRPSWVRVQAADGSILFEKILNAGERYVVPAMEEAPILRTGNAGGIYFNVNGQAYGPAGASGSVVKNIALAEADLSGGFDAVDLAQNEPICEMFQVASTADLSCN